ncbi:MAG: ExbD/TolR family protein [Kiritimatiellia bacterium]
MKALVDAGKAMHVDMTPLVDAIFAIILFLLVVSSYVESNEQNININLQKKGPGAVKPLPRPIVVNVGYLPGNEAYYSVENERMSVAALTVNLIRAQQLNKDQAVIIRSDSKVKWDHLAKAMISCSQAAITRVSASVETLD